MNYKVFRRLKDGRLVSSFASNGKTGDLCQPMLEYHPNRIRSISKKTAGAFYAASEHEAASIIMGSVNLSGKFATAKVEVYEITVITKAPHLYGTIPDCLNAYTIRVGKRRKDLEP